MSIDVQALARALGHSDIIVSGDRWLLTSDVPPDPASGWPWKTVAELTPQQLEVYSAPTSDQVNAERDRRLAAGAALTPTGHGAPVLINDQDRENLADMTQIATLMIAAGNGAATTQWRDNADVVHTMTFEQVVDLFGMAAAYKQAIYQASWALKDNPGGIPANYTDDTHWPNPDDF